MLARYWLLGPRQRMLHLITNELFVGLCSRYYKRVFFFSNFVPYPLVPNDRHVRRQGHGCTVHTKVVYGPKESHDSTTFGQSIDPTKSHVNAAWLFSVYKKSPRNLGMILKRAMAAHL